MPTEIPLTRGFVAIVDDEDAEMVRTRKWHATSRKDGKVYAAGGVTRKKQYTTMHRFILKAMPGQQVDHRDGNGLNNQRNNLRLCTAFGNTQNRRKFRGGSRFKGVAWAKSASKWRVEIRANGRRINGGLFVSEEDAARRYDELAIAHHGEFARINFPHFT